MQNSQFGEVCGLWQLAVFMIDISQNDVISPTEKSNLNAIFSVFILYVIKTVELYLCFCCGCSRPVVALYLCILYWCFFIIYFLILVVETPLLVWRWWWNLVSMCNVTQGRSLSMNCCDYIYNCHGEAWCWQMW
jgi:hypothetical protein